ncbi:MAG: extracellular solute-binding protein [Bacilli bacterium]|nr:extracellular solute-binding protein [Sphaerochaetaceae bacterium]
MKKLLTIMLILSVVLVSTFAQAEKEEVAGSGTLVLYSTVYDAEYNMIVDAFQAKYPNITVECVNGGAGELKTRIKAEAENPQADAMFGGLLYSDYISMGDNFEPYVAKNNDNMPEGFKNDTGCLTYNTIQFVNLLVNRAEAKKLGVEIKSYKDLLNPALKGKIITANPAASSSAWNQLSTILAVMGGYESDEAWSYVDKLVQNLDGVMSSSSSSVFKGVYNGEYVVGLTYEAPCVTYIEEGKGDIVEIVYPTEGITAIPFASGIIKNAKHMDNAKLFMDFVVSDEAQKLWAGSTARQANINLPTTNEVLTPAGDIKVVQRDAEYLANHQVDIVANWEKIWSKHN